jgi:2-hydroxymuconate-semialdehyde hydrolase
MHDGGSGPAVLLLHGPGPGTTSAAWGPLIAALEPRHRVIAPDLLGFGESPLPVGPLREAWTTQVSDLLDSLAIRSCAVVGNSAGGAIAFSLARARRELVTKVVAVGSMGHPMTLPPGLDELWGYEPGQAAAKELIELLNYDPAAATPEAIEARLAATLAQPHYPSLFPAPRQRWVDDLSLSSDELATIAVPVLLVHGAQDRIVPLADGALALLQLLPDVRAHVFGHCGHASPLERTDEFNALLTTFLETDR